MARRSRIARTPAASCAPADVGPVGRAAGLGASRPRSRRRDLLRPARSLRPDAGRRPRPAAPRPTSPSDVRPEFVVAVARPRRARGRPSRSIRSCRPARSKSSPTTLEILNEAKTPPFPINDDAPVAEETRLRYRYLDLRRPALQQNLVLRHKVALAARRYFDAQGFSRSRRRS